VANRSAWLGVVAAWAPVLLIAPAGCSAARGEEDDLSGRTVQVVAVWRDAEAAAFEEVLAEFEARTGATVEFTSTEGRDVGAVLDARLADGDPPEVAILPQPGLLQRYAREGAVDPVDDQLAAEIKARYGAQWRRLATLDGELYGVWFKAANKSLVWYSIGAFERAGVVPPDDIDGLEEVATALTASDTPPFAVTAAPEDAWTLTDWFENLYLRVAGPERYDDLAAHRLAWTDESVERTLGLLARLLAPDHVAGGPASALTTSLAEGAAAVFSPAPSAAMVVEGDFVPGVVAGESEAEIGVDVDVFRFPETRVGERLVVGGGDIAVQMRRSEAGAALLRFLATGEAGEIWAARGGFLSANEDVDLIAYPDDTTRDIARALLEAGDGFRFDLSDLQPVEFGGTTGAGMWAALRDFLADPSDIAGTMARLEADADAAWSRP
jgi:ABC-type glycerol-3-phosphate transport system substrate-binding protein